MELCEKIKSIAKNRPTPFLIMDVDLVEDNFNKLKASFPESRIFYAIKANSHPRIISRLNRLGCHYDAASKGEIDKLLSLGIVPENISFGNTIKREEHIRFAHSIGIRLYVADAESEVRKIARAAPGSSLFVRLEMDSGDSDWPLSHKFGTSREKAIELMILAKELGLKPYGLSFHVGSQCYNPKRWPVALEKCLYVFKGLKEQGIELEMLNLGGGFPVPHTKPIPGLNNIAEEVYSYIKNNFDPVPEIFLEPGRYLCGDAGIMVSSVITRREYGRENWLFIDAGVFHGLMETIEGFQYEVRTEKNGSEHLGEFYLAGPTCDSVDVIYNNVILPISIKEGDRIYFINTGAYTIEYASSFNGIDPPVVLFIDDLDTQEINEKQLP